MLYLSLHAKLIYSFLSRLPLQALPLLAALWLLWYIVFYCIVDGPFEKLVKAVGDGNDEEVNITIRDGVVELDKLDKEGLTPLLRAARCGHYNIMLALLKAGCKVNGTDKTMKTALMMASSMGHYNAVDLLIRHGARISAKDENGNTALILAAQRGFLDIVKLLAQNGADINWKNAYGLSSLNAGMTNYWILFKFTAVCCVSVYLYIYIFTGRESFVRLERTTLQY